jgi:hypothetical protein
MDDMVDHSISSAEIHEDFKTHQTRILLRILQWTGRRISQFSMVSKMQRNGTKEIGIGTVLQMSILLHSDIGSTRTKRSVHVLSVDSAEDRRLLGLDLLFWKI